MQLLPVLTLIPIRIEPDWNVKAKLKEAVKQALIIRIEPDWNVKTIIETIANHLGVD